MKTWRKSVTALCRFFSGCSNSDSASSDPSTGGLIPEPGSAKLSVTAVTQVTPSSCVPKSLCIGNVYIRYWLCYYFNSDANCIHGFQYKTWWNYFSACIRTFWTFSAHFNNNVIILITVTISVTIIVIWNFHTVSSPVNTLTVHTLQPYQWTGFYIVQTW